VSSPVTLIACTVLGNHNIGGKGTAKVHLDSRGTLFRFKVCDRYALYLMRIYFAAPYADILCCFEWDSQVHTSCTVASGGLARPVLLSISNVSPRYGLVVLGAQSVNCAN
jgi:hypothetical protein